MVTATKEINPAKVGGKTAPPPSPNSDFYELVETLPAEDLAVVKQVRTFMESKVAPIITKYWIDDAFPFEVLPAIKELNIGGLGMQGYGCRGGSALWPGFNRTYLTPTSRKFARFMLNVRAPASLVSPQAGQKKVTPVSL